METGIVTSKRTRAQEPTTRGVAQTLESLKRAGVTHVPRRRGAKLLAESAKSLAPAEPVMPPAARPQPDKTRVLPTAKVANAAPAARGDRVAALELIQSEVRGCVRCPELAATRTQTVFGVGNPQARLVFCGEAPGADEDRQGEPFVGRAGQLLTKIIEACTLSREEVYILNVLKCRPPGNRNPEPAEVANCRGYLDRQLKIIQPEYICCLGKFAAQAVLQTDVAIGKLRKQFHEYEGIPVLVTYHPAYLLRNPPAKRDVWEDMQMLMKAMGIKLPNVK